MNPGKLRHRIEILENANAQRSGPDEWVSIRKLWASKEPLLGREFFAAEAAQSKVEVKFRTRYYPGIESTMRVLSDNVVYEIIGQPVDVEGRKRELLIYAKRVE